MVSDRKPAAEHSHLPVGFDDWDRERQIEHLAFSHTRRGLVAAVLSHSGVEMSTKDVGRNYVLTKDDLAAIYLTLEGVE